MNYRFQFGVVWQNWDALAMGALTTLLLGIAAFAGGLLIGLVGASIKSYGPRPVRILADAYVVLFTNTPALIQIYFLYYGLPEAGVLWSAETCVLIGLILNAGAYLTLILRAGFLSVRKSEMEAAETLGFSLIQQIRHVIVPHIGRTVYPALANFFVVILVMGTSIGAVFGIDELTGTAISLSTSNYRWLEYFSAIAVIYIALTLVASVALGLVGRHFLRLRTGLL